MEKEKRDFFEKYVLTQKPNFSKFYRDDKILLKNFVWFSYDFVNIKPISSRNIEFISKLDIYNFAKTAYSYKYNCIKLFKEQGVKEYQNSKVADFLSDVSKKPNKMSSIDCYNYIFNSESVKKTKKSIIEIGKEGMPFLNDNLVCDYFEFNPNGYNGDEGILILDLGCGNVCKVVNDYINKCFENDIPVKLKFNANNRYNFPLQIHTSYKNAEKNIEILNQIQKENPLLFNCYKPYNSIFAQINDYISFVECGGIESGSRFGNYTLMFKEYHANIIMKKLKNQIDCILNNSEINKDKCIEIGAKKMISRTLVCDLKLAIEKQLSDIGEGGLLRQYGKNPQKQECYTYVCKQLLDILNREGVDNVQNENYYFINDIVDEVYNKFINMEKISKNFCVGLDSVQILNLNEKTGINKMDQSVLANRMILVNVYFNSNVVLKLAKYFQLDQSVLNEINEDDFETVANNNNVSIKYKGISYETQKDFDKEEQLCFDF